MLAVQLDATLGRRSADTRRRFGGRTLLVGDDAGMLQLLERLLLEGGLGPLTMTSSTSRALALFRDLNPDVVLLDVDMSAVDPIPMIRQMNARVPDTEFLPIVVIAADASPEQKQALLGEGACDFVDRKTGLSDLPWSARASASPRAPQRRDALRGRRRVSPWAERRESAMPLRARMRKGSRAADNCTRVVCW